MYDYGVLGMREGHLSRNSESLHLQVLLFHLSGQSVAFQGGVFAGMHGITLFLSSAILHPFLTGRRGRRGRSCIVAWLYKVEALVDDAKRIGRGAGEKICE